MPLILPGNVGSATAATGYDVANSCRFNDGDSAYMHKTPGGAGTSADLFTFSMWIKRGIISSSDRIVLFYAQSDAQNFDRISFTDADVLEWKGVRSDSQAFNLTTSQVFRDISSWYHLHFIWDSADSTADNRMRIYVNGTQVTAFGTRANPSSGLDAIIGSAQKHSVGSTGSSGTYYDGYMAEVVYLDGQELTPDGNTGEFDEDSGIWKPIDVSGLTFGNNGFYLDYEDSGNLGNDANGGTDLTEVNLAAIDQSIDTCTNNFATLNPLDLYYNATASTGSTLTEGNLYYQVASGNKGFARSTFGVSAGKWYFEVEANSVGKGFYGVCHEGIMVDDTTLQNSAVYYYEAVPDFRSGDEIVTTNAVSVSAGDILGFALDMDNYALYISKNGTYMNSGNPGSGSSRTGAISEEFTNGRAVLSDYGPIFANVSNTSTTGGLDTLLNFGSPPYSESGGNADGNGFGNFKTAPPSGYLAFCTKNLAETGG